MNVRDWTEVNQAHLAASLAAVRSALERHAAGEEPSPELAAPAWDLDPPPALEALCGRFGLSPFERAVLLLAAGAELDGGFGELFAKAHGDPQKGYPTFGLALAALPGAHWSALSPDGPLRFWRLVELRGGTSVTSGPLAVDERILHFLSGVAHLDERLLGLVEPLAHASGVGDDLVPSHRALAERIAATWSGMAASAPLSVVQLIGRDRAEKRAVAALACAHLGLSLFRTSRQVLPSSPAELTALARLWEREAALSGGALLLDCDDLGVDDAGAESVVSRLVDSLDGPLILSSRERRRLGERPAIVYEVGPPTPAEQLDVWRSAVEGVVAKIDGGLDGEVAALVSQFNLSVPTIRAASAEALARLAASGALEKPETAPSADADEDGPAAVLGRALWEAARVQARPRLGELAQRIRPAAEWDDLVLPEPEKSVLRQIAVHVRQRLKVYETWGFAAKSARGLGISALFVGPSGTGKTMASEVLANELSLDLYRIDLSQVISKYIGETEKNLRRVFDEAEEGGAILLFDEADALFGKRSEVKDSHDRYANIEIGYLLQRMEAYRGLAVLTTNMKDALDHAFLRRLRFIVRFPFPDAGQRAEIWRSVFPGELGEGLDVRKLARLNVAGGNIRNIALAGAFLAAADGDEVAMGHLLEAARSEYAKLGRPLSAAEIEGWT